MVFERKGFAREMVSNCNVGATTYTVCWVGQNRIFEIQLQVVFERKGFAREMVSNCNVGATTYTVCWVGTDRGGAGHASPVKWCLNEKVQLLCKLAMPCLLSGV